MARLTDRILLRYPAWSMLALGALAATGFPPLDLWPVALLAMGAAGHILHRSGSMRRAAWLGWLFGVAHFTVADNWIAAAFTHQSNMPAILGWFAVPLLSLYLAVYPALAAAAAQRLFGRTRTLPFALAYAGLWTIAEWLRSWVFTGYAWGPFSLLLLGPMDRTGLAALLPFMGTYALSACAVLIGRLLFELLERRYWVAAAIAFAAMALGMYFPAPTQRDTDLRYTLVQPNLSQAQLVDPREYEPAFLTMAGLSARQQDDGRRIVLWPESGLPDYLRPGYPQRYYDETTAGRDPRFARKRLGQVIGPDSRLLTGNVDLVIDPAQQRAIGAYNVVTALDPDGDIVGSYRKAHLVPYGEYLPLRWLLEPLGASRLVAGAFDFLAGPGARTIDLGDYGKVGVQICYEIVFSGEVVDRAHRPDYIFTPSNDGWFGAWGPPQHFAQSRMRAIEEGLPVLRSTVNGISGVIDANGVVRQHLPHGVAGRLTGLVPAAKAPTLFSRFGNALALAWAAAFLLASLVAMRRRPR
ncbi:apolipoprotein N-acyltransferase [Erythrobacter sp. 3-20A1M]|uniref:apolipoprotein N-acyltransferase n=1 Tax=Erythrobacter sp. 3-20A1M TaxID=2653850 RepID=UPI001BFBFB06|nr:apolipoprotein N-acyltransferase [Erythrobacter sp. 3-20A1M]QWC57193.1 apolipoprotein N-acyltransferase [Erythrobacter sp. 3-20A1M]